VLVALVTALAAGRPAQAAPSSYIWWEAENPVSSTFRDVWKAADLDYPDALSGGNWLCHLGPGHARAQWQIQVPKAGTYNFYARKFWYHGPFKWRFDAADWQTADRPGLLDHANLSKDGFVCANWVGLGSVVLAEGQHDVFVDLEPGGPPPSHIGDDAWTASPKRDLAAFDCFVLTEGPFAPRGKLKPGEAAQAPMSGYWTFAPATDPFGSSPIDLSYLNEKPAGKYGALKCDGDQFAFENLPGPVRFWGVCVGQNAVLMDEASVRYLAQKLSKGGVNVVRVHAPVMDWGSLNPAKVDMDHLKRLQFFVHTMKEQGIYTYLSFYAPLWFDVKSGWNFPPPGTTKKPWSLLFFHKRMQDIYDSWLSTLLTRPNPYDQGLPLGQDPAVAIVEIVNDDNYFQWTFDPEKSILSSVREDLEKGFGTWAADKYGSVANALLAWNYGLPGDGPKKLALMNMWNLTQQGLAGNPPWHLRALDQGRFLAEGLRTFFHGKDKDVHGWTGSSPQTVASNTYLNPDLSDWDPLDRYVHVVCPVMDRHAESPEADPAPSEGHNAIGVGDVYQDRCGAKEPGALAVREIQYEGHPHTISEYSFPMPNRYRTDAPFMAAVYGSLQGTDGICFFRLDGPTWQQTLTRWPVMTPSQFGQFPAAALAYRRGDVKEAGVAVHQVLKPSEVFGRSWWTTARSDPTSTPAGAQVRNLHPLAYYVGRVVRLFSEDVSSGFAIDLSRCIDVANERITSLTGEETFDYGHGIVTVNTPRCQGASGLLGAAGAIELTDVTMSIGNEYGCVMVVSLDGAPISSAERILVQVMTEETNYGWKVTQQGQGCRVDELGPGPLNVLHASGDVTIRRPDAATLQVRALDANGYEVGAVKATVAPGAMAFRLASDVLYYVVTKRGG
jgi:hypothetical protein